MWPSRLKTNSRGGLQAHGMEVFQIVGGQIQVFGEVIPPMKQGQN